MAARRFLPFIAISLGIFAQPLFAADNVTVSNGQNSDNPDYNTATDDVGGVHFQKFKLFDPTADSSAAIGVAANPLWVTISNDLTIEAIPLPPNAARETGGNLAALAAKDFATQATLAALEGKDFATETTLAALAAEDFATQATLAALNAKIPASPAQDRTTAAAPSSARLSDGTSFYKATTPADTQPISAASLPLPADAATAANQATGNASLSSIDGKITACNTGSIAGSVSVSALPNEGQQLMANSVSVAIASDQGALPVSDNGGAITVDGTVSAAQSGAWLVTANAGTNLNTSALALESGGNLAALVAKDFATETTLSALNAKVTACNTGAVVISSSALPAGAATSALQTTGNTSLSSIATNTSNTAARFVAATALSDAQANPNTTRVGAALQVFNGTTWDRARGDTSNGLDVDVTRSVLPSNAATETTLSSLNGKDFATQTTLAALAAEDFATEATLDNIRDTIVGTAGSSQQVQGPVANGGAIAGKNVFPIAFQDLLGNAIVPTGIQAGGIYVLGTIPVDLALNIQDFSALGEVYVQSLVAHDAADSGNPIKVGGQAVTNNDALTAVASADRSDFSTDRRKRLIVDSDRMLPATAQCSSTAATTLIAAPGAGLKIQVYKVVISLAEITGSAASQAEFEGVEFRFGAGSYFGASVFGINEFNKTTGDETHAGKQPFLIDLAQGHWDGGDNEAFSMRQMGLGSLTTNFYVTAWYRIMPV